MSEIRNVDAGDDRPLLLHAVHVVARRKRISPRQFQRCLRVGFVKAGRLTFLLEDAGVLAPLKDGYRDILIEFTQLNEALTVLGAEVTHA